MTDDNRSFVDSVFRAWSHFYDNPLQQKLYFGPIQDNVLARLKPGQQILDLGCGTGELIVKLEGLESTRVFGMDLSHDMLLKAAEKPSLAGRLAVSDGHRLPLADNSVDVITCLISFHYYLEPLVALKEMQRVIKPGGTLILAALTAVFFELDSLDTAFKSATQHLFRVYPPSELQELMVDAGFSTVEHDLVRPFTRVFEASN